MHMMAPKFALANSLRLDPPTNSTSEDVSTAVQQKKTSQWT